MVNKKNKDDLLKLDINQDVLKTIPLQLDQLALLAQLEDTIEKWVDTVYSDKFPKKCKGCDRLFETREQYIKETAALSNERTDVFKGQFIEYRNCVCGSTLVLMGEDRRDTTPFGVARRNLFNECVEAFVASTGEDKNIATKKIKDVFSRVLRKKQDP